MRDASSATTSCETARPKSRTSVWLLVLGLWLISAPVAAQEAAPPPTYEIYMNAARKLYAAERYREAIEQFEKAYAAHPDPKIYFNLAQSHRKLGERREALALYEKFLEAIPGIGEFSERQKRDFTQEVRLLIEELRAVPGSTPDGLKDADRAISPVPSPRRPAAKPGITSRWWFWAGVGATAAFTAGTVFSGLKTVALNDEWEAHREVADHDRAVRWQNATDILLLGALVSGVSVTAAVLLWEPRTPATGGAPRVGVTVGAAGGWALTLGWEF